MGAILLYKKGAPSLEIHRLKEPLVHTLATLSVDEKKTKISFTFRIWAGQINSGYYFRVVAPADSMLSFFRTRLSFSSLLWLLFLEKKLLIDKAL